MNRRNTLLVLLSTLLIFSPLVCFYKALPIARATYVEGTITQNTEWTLVDSPFILSNSILVNPGVTLTIEPGVQVKFGGKFTLIVNGRLVAEGTDESMIRFTSNSLNPSMGDWETVLITSPGYASITHCTIEYGTNGVTLESGSLNLQDSLVQFNSNGTVINGGDATIMNNVISANEHGVELIGNLNGNINIAQNNITQNSQSGIVLGADSYSNTAIVQNNVSSNTDGFRVVSNTSTYITRNYISNNINGIYYDKGAGHKAHFNNIYDNAKGIDLTARASEVIFVNATNNYWGDETGPFHGYLNPAGKGNEVGGNGTNLDFIFFLSMPIDHNNQSPIALLQTDKTLVAPNQYVTFIGANSHDDGRVDQYFYDFGDGTNSGWTTLSLLNHTYSNVGTYTATLTVMDDFGVPSQNVHMATITVQNLTPLTVSMALSSPVVDYHGNVTVTVYVSTASGAAANAAVRLFSAKGGSYSPSSGVTDANGQFETTFTAPNVTDTADVRLIAGASNSGYADGSCYAYLTVLPLLKIQITTQPTTVKSEATVTMIFKVTGGLNLPVAGASLTAAVDNGILLTDSGITGTDGTLSLDYSAPYTISPMNVIVSASAQKPGFTSGYAQETISVLPKVLIVQLTADSDSTVSEASLNVTALVIYDLLPVPDANVTVTSQNMGNFTETVGTTDSQGLATFIFTPPQTNAPLDIVITAVGAKTGYANGQDSFTLNVNPGNISVIITASSYEPAAGSNVMLTVTALAGLNPVSDAQVIISASDGSFSYTSGLTSQNGTCSFTFHAPSENVQLPVTITANVTKNGYIGNEDQITINVKPQSQGGFPWMTMLLIIIPIVIVVLVVAILIKRKVIVVSPEEESASKESVSK